MTRSSVDYARDALKHTNGNGEDAVELLVQWAQGIPDVYAAFIPRDELSRRAKQAVKTVQRADRVGAVRPAAVGSKGRGMGVSGAGDHRSVRTRQA